MVWGGSAFHLPCTAFLFVSMGFWGIKKVCGNACILSVVGCIIELQRIGRRTEGVTMNKLVVPAAKVKTCEKCGGHWAWRETKAGKFYPANAVYMGDQPKYGRHEVRYETIYHVDLLAHSRFCETKINQDATAAAWAEKNIAAIQEQIEMAKAMNVPAEVIAALEAKIDSYKAGA